MAKETEDTRADFLVKEKSFLGHSIHEEGAHFFIDPDLHPADSHISDNLTPVNAAAQKMVDDQKEPHPDKTVKKAKPAVTAPKPAGAAPVAEAAAEQPVEQPADDLA